MEAAADGMAGVLTEPHQRCCARSNERTRMRRSARRRVEFAILRRARAPARGATFEPLAGPRRGATFERARDDDARAGRDRQADTLPHWQLAWQEQALLCGALLCPRAASRSPPSLACASSSVPLSAAHARPSTCSEPQGAIGLDASTCPVHNLST